MLILLLFLPLVLCKILVVSELVRHGSRYPLRETPYVSGPLGELTYSGARQQYVLGTQLRKEFSDVFEDPDFDLEKIWVFADDFDRTIQSASAQLMGMFASEFELSDSEQQIAVPPFKVAKTVSDDFNTPLPGNYIPIPIHTLPDE